MSVDIKSIRTAVASIISANNTTTSSFDISSGLSKRVQDVYEGYAKSPVPNILYPCVFVELKDKSKDFGAVGRGSNRINIVNIDVVAITDTGMGQIPGRDKSDSDMIVLADKLETLFDGYTTLSSTVQSCLVVSTSYDESMSNDTYNSIARLSLRIEKYTN